MAKAAYPLTKLESRIYPVLPSFPGIDNQQRQGGRWLQRTSQKSTGGIRRSGLSNSLFFPGKSP